MQDDDGAIELEDPQAFAELERALSPAEMQHVLLELEKIHPRARSFAEALLDGDTKTEIAEAWRVTPSYISKWFRENREDFAAVLQRHLRTARRHYTYDRRLPYQIR